MDFQQPLSYSVQVPSFSNDSLVGTGEDVHHIVAGSFHSLSLFLLAFSPVKRTVTHVRTIQGYGPHQYLALNERRDRLYATSWSLPPKLFCWEIEYPDSSLGHSDGEPTIRVNFVNEASITATSSYISLPPPHTHIYSAGGPTGEVHTVGPDSRGFGDKIQEILFVPAEELEKADKTRVALRYGSHAVEFTPSGSHGFIPVLGTDTIEMYTRNRSSGILAHVRSIPSPRGPEAHDGPRHIKIHPNGKILYAIAEHSNLVDAYRIDTSSNTLTHLSSRSLLPPGLSPHQGEYHFRGDTLQLAPSTPDNPSPRSLVTTTRGSSSALKGWLSIFRLHEDGSFVSSPDERTDDVIRWETPTSGGKANAIDLLPIANSKDRDALWILLTDDDDHLVQENGGAGSIRVVEWDGWASRNPRVIAVWPEQKNVGEEDLGERIQGASHALWLD